MAAAGAGGVDTSSKLVKISFTTGWTKLPGGKSSGKLHYLPPDQLLIGNTYSFRVDIPTGDESEFEEKTGIFKGVRDTPDPHRTQGKIAAEPDISIVTFLLDGDTETTEYEVPKRDNKEFFYNATTKQFIDNRIAKLKKTPIGSFSAKGNRKEYPLKGGSARKRKTAKRRNNKRKTHRKH